jgi:energy-coupling factor transporter ATP-binding protein EcfA2
VRIRSLIIENFRAVRLLELADLPDGVVVAGPNGCGKSSIFDAIRLLKSAYGQYHQNEYQWWFNEFQIDIQRIRQDAPRVLHDPSKPLRLSAEFEITTGEREYLRAHARDLYLAMNWAQLHGVVGRKGQAAVVNPATRRAQGPIVEHQTTELMNELEKVIDAPTHIAELNMAPNQDPIALASPVLELMFSVYMPEHLGIVDYHGANRSYSREQVGGINLQIQDAAQQQGQHALYNTQNKYNGVKTQMAQSYVRQMLAKEAGVRSPDSTDLKDTLDELFSVFFPGKTFLGVHPTADGGLAFPVRLENGREHDINELSSGEKEVLLGYLRLRNSAPHNSIILLDEPELHLNPRLIRGLPRFYQKHLGEAMDNQLWLITHSDSLLREAVEEPAYAVYHMQAAYATPEGANQVVPVSASAEVERTIIDLVGDLATYSPRSKVVLLEGENSDFDESLISELFPEFSERVNLISIGNKRRVGAVHELLEKVADEGRLDTRFYSIVDRDFGGTPLVEADRRFAWDVYHIENYLLDPRFIREAMRGLQLGEEPPSEHELEFQLRACAAETIDDLIRIRMEQRVNSEMVHCISTKYEPNRSAAAGFREAAERSLQRMQVVITNHLTEEKLLEEELQFRQELTFALDNGNWNAQFRGRDILRRLTGKYRIQLGVPYEKFRNLVVNRMREAGYRPSGMGQVISRILAE